MSAWLKRLRQAPIGCFLVLGAVGLLISTLGSAQTEDWRLRLSDDDNEIVVHTRKRPGNYTEFRGVTRVHARLSSLVAVLRDIEGLPDWAYRTTLAKRLKRVSPYEAIIYTVAHLPWPFRDRDLIVRSRLRQDPVSLAVTIDGESLPDYLPLDPAYVRVPFLRSSWQFIPLDKRLVEVRFLGYGDGGGNLSSGILNWFSRIVVSEAPHQSLIGLRRMVALPRYQNSTVSVVREPLAAP